MVKLHTSLLAITLATGAALASSNDYQRREVGQFRPRYGLGCAGRLQSRGLVDEEDLFERDDVLDDLEAREPLGGKGAGNLLKWGTKVAGHKHTRNTLKTLDYGSQAYGAYQMLKSRDLEDNDDLFVRDLDTVDDLEAREPLGGKGAGNLLKWGTKVAGHKHTRTALKTFDYGSQAYGAYQSLKSRDLEDNDDLFVRDLDTVDDLEAREPLGGKGAGNLLKWGTKVAGHKHTRNALKTLDYGSQAYGAYQMLKSRDLEDNDDLFVRDLDTEELFGREYDLLDERDIIDDLD